MKISKKKYLKAVKEVEKGKEAQEIVNEWEEAMEEQPEMFEQADVVEIERTDDGFRLTVQKLLVDA